MSGAFFWRERLLKTGILQRYLIGSAETLRVRKACDVFCIDPESIYNLASLRHVRKTYRYAPKAIQRCLNNAVIPGTFLVGSCSSNPTA